MFIRHIFVFTLMVAAWPVSASNAAEEGSTDWNTATLTGDWGGARSNLYNKGVSLEFSHKSDVLANTSGGIKRGTAWMGHTEAIINLDMEKLLGWDAATAYIHYHSQLGSKFNRDYIGSFNGVDNIETGVNTAQFYQAWVQKNLADDSLSVLAGLYAIDSEFYVTDTSGVFIQPPYGPGNELSQSGHNGPPIFPLGALALRVKYTTPGKHFYLQGALADGVPGDPSNPRGTHVKLGNGDGTLSIVEFGYTPQQSELLAEPSPTSISTAPEAQAREESEFFNKTAIGFWRYSAHFDDLIDVDAAGNPVRRPSQGVYFLAERTLSVEKNHPSQGLSSFIRFGTASRDIHQSDWMGSVGLRYHGLISGRDDDIAGIAVTVNHASDKYQRITPSLRSERSVEATYRVQINPWLALQPVLQYISSPNMDAALGNAWVIGTRLEVAF